MSDAAAVVVGAVISGVIGVLVVIVQTSLTRRHQVHTAQVERLAEFSAAVWQASLAIGRVAHAPTALKESAIERESLSEIFDRVNSAMARVQLMEAGEVHQTAHRVDRLAAELFGDARRRTFETAE